MKLLADARPHEGLGKLMPNSSLDDAVFACTGEGGGEGGSNKQEPFLQSFEQRIMIVVYSVSSYLPIRWHDPRSALLVKMTLGVPFTNTRFVQTVVHRTATNFSSQILSGSLRVTASGAQRLYRIRVPDLGFTGLRAFQAHFHASVSVHDRRLRTSRPKLATIFMTLP